VKWFELRRKDARGGGARLKSKSVQKTIGMERPRRIKRCVEQKAKGKRDSERLRNEVGSFLMGFQASRLSFQT